MSVTIVSMMLVVSSLGVLTPSMLYHDARSCDATTPPRPQPAEDVAAAAELANLPQAGGNEVRSVLRSLRRLADRPASPPASTPPQERGGIGPHPLPVAPALTPAQRVPAPIWPSVRFLSRLPAAAVPATAGPRSPSDAEPERRLVPAPLLQIRTVYPAQTSVGRSLRLTVAIRNAGTATAGRLRIRTTLPEHALFVASHPEPSAVDQEGLQFELGDLPAGAKQEITLELVPRTARPVVVRSVADFSLAAQSTTRVGRPQLTLSCQAPETVDLGSQVRYRLLIRNTGDGVAEQVVVEPQVLAGGRSRTAGGKRFPVGDVPPGESREMTLRDLARDAESLHVRFYATDRKGSETVAEARVAVRRPAVEISLEGPAQMRLSEPAVFEIRATNAGSGAAEPVRVLCSVGAGLRLTVLDQQVQFAAQRGQTAWAIGRLAPGETRVLRLKARPTTAGEHLIRVAIERRSDAGGRLPRPAVAEKTVTVRDRAADERTASCLPGNAPPAPPAHT